jgi:hypothetical protein
MQLLTCETSENQSSVQTKKLIPPMKSISLAEWAEKLYLPRRGDWRVFESQGTFKG